MKVRKLTRRQLAGAIAGAMPLMAQNPQPESPAELLKEAVRETGERIQAIEKVNLPVSTQPASVFRTL